MLEVWDSAHLGNSGLSDGMGGNGVIAEGIPSSFISARARNMLRRDGATAGSVSTILEVSNTIKEM